MLVAGEIVEPASDRKLVVDVLRHAGLVDRQRDDRGAKPARELEPFVGGILAILEIDRVDDRLAAVELQRRFEHRVLGRVDDERRIDRAAHAGHRLADVGDLVTADKGGAQIERVRALLDLLAGHLDAAVPVARLLQLAEFARAVGVAALADRQPRVLLAQRDLAIERGDGRRPSRAARSRRRARPVPAEPAQHRVEGGDVRGVGAAAAADHRDAVLDDKALEPLRQFGGAERVAGMAVDQLGQAGIGLDRNQAGPVFAEPFDMLGHLARAGRAIEADDRHV